MVTTLYLVRHGESLGNTEGFFQGRTDCKLSENGFIQADALKELFREIDFDVIYSSPLARTRETAAAINFHKNLPIQIDSNIIEIDGGDFEGVPFNDIPNKYPTEFEKWCKTPSEFSAPNGETMEQVFERMKTAISTIVTKNIGKTIVVVSHGCSIKNYLCYAMGLSHSALDQAPWSENASLSKISFDEKLTPTVIFANDDKHIASLGLTKPTYWRNIK